jgi:hypothetical protein
MLNENKVIEYARMLKAATWYTGNELDITWGVNKTKRRAIVLSLTKRNVLYTRGKTSKILYKLHPESGWQIKTIEKTGNGVIDAKLRKEAGVSEIPSALENLIGAATDIGTENELLKQALRDINAIITKVRESL